MLNQRAYAIVEEIISRKEELGVVCKQDGAHIIDAGVEAEGNYQAGKLFAEACLGGLGKVELSLHDYSGMLLPQVAVVTEKPAIATLASQKAGWNLKSGSFFALGSGPARALAKKPKDVYEKLGYSEGSDKAVIALEASSYPPEEVVEEVAESCGLDKEKVYILIARTSSIAGAVQISSRVVETALYKLDHLGIDTKKVKFAMGTAPVAPVVGGDGEMMGTTNDMVIYAGEVYLTSEVDFDVSKVPSRASPAYGRPFMEIFKEAGYDFYKINPAIFAPAKVSVNFLRSKKIESAGDVALEVVKESIKF